MPFKDSGFHQRVIVTFPGLEVGGEAHIVISDGSVFGLKLKSILPGSKKKKCVWGGNKTETNILLQSLNIFI